MTTKNSRFLQGNNADDEGEPVQGAKNYMCSCFEKKNEDQEETDQKNGGLNGDVTDEDKQVGVCEIEAVEKWFKEQKERAANTKQLEETLYGNIESKLEEYEVSLWENEEFFLWATLHQI